MRLGLCYHSNPRHHREQPQQGISPSKSTLSIVVEVVKEEKPWNLLAASLPLPHWCPQPLLLLPVPTMRNPWLPFRWGPPVWIWVETPGSLIPKRWVWVRPLQPNNQLFRAITESLMISSVVADLTNRCDGGSSAKWQSSWIRPTLSLFSIASTRDTLNLYMQSIPDRLDSYLWPSFSSFFPLKNCCRQSN